MDDPVRRLQYLRRVAVTLPICRAAPSPRGSWWLMSAPAWLAVLVVFFPLRIVSDSADLPPQLPQLSSSTAAPDSFSNVWLVERAADSDVYSNGLRVYNAFATSHQPRSYQVFARNPLGAQPSSSRTAPAGIVFHTTESHLAPFQAETNRALQRAGMAMLEYVRRRHSYHFVIDRFGRVYRVVVETDSADHAGHSVWADERWIYLELNHSFLGVAFEAHNQSPDGRPRVNAAQVHSARVLTEYLRARYRIPAANCVTHAQVSVNPSNYEVGYHTDWADGLPFAEMGLPDNYTRVLPSIHLFGFRADTIEPWRGAQAAESLLEREASSQSISLRQYRAILHQRYSEMAAALHPDL